MSWGSIPWNLIKIKVEAEPDDDGGEPVYVEVGQLTRKMEVIRGVQEIKEGLVHCIQEALCEDNTDIK